MSSWAAQTHCWLWRLCCLRGWCQGKWNFQQPGVSHLWLWWWVPDMGCWELAETSLQSFLVLIDRPKLSQAVESLSISSWISCFWRWGHSRPQRESPWLQSPSPLWRPAEVSGWTTSRLALCLILTPASQSLNASVSIVENIKLNSVGARTQPCFTPELCLYLAAQVDKDSLFRKAKGVALVGSK